jgi:hypothetical protein
MKGEEGEGEEGEEGEEEEQLMMGVRERMRMKRMR